MTLEALNRVIGEAVVNRQFCNRLLAEPRAAVAGFDLAIDELELLTNIAAESLDQLARRLLAELRLEDSVPAPRAACCTCLPHFPL